jgi:4-hydroxy-L-threonine phosphate dehydrogenase PdxA
MSALTGVTTGDPAGVGPEITVQARAERLDVEGRILPGVLRSILRGGRFDGVRVVS